MSLEEWETWDRNTYTARMLCEDEGRDWGDASTSHRTLKIARKPPEARKKHGTNSSL